MSFLSTNESEYFDTRSPADSGGFLSACSYESTTIETTQTINKPVHSTPNREVDKGAVINTELPVSVDNNYFISPAKSLDGSIDCDGSSISTSQSSSTTAASRSFITSIHSIFSLSISAVRGDEFNPISIRTTGKMASDLESLTLVQEFTAHRSIIW